MVWFLNMKCKALTNLNVTCGNSNTVSCAFLFSLIHEYSNLRNTTQAQIHFTNLQTFPSKPKHNED